MYGANVRAEGAKFLEDCDGVGPADPNMRQWVGQTLPGLAGSTAAHVLNVDRHQQQQIRVS